MECFGLCLLCILCWIIKKRKKKKCHNHCFFSARIKTSSKQLSANAKRAKSRAMKTYLTLRRGHDYLCRPMSSSWHHVQPSAPRKYDIALMWCWILFIYSCPVFFFFCHSHRRGDLISSSSSSHLPTQSLQTPPPHLYFQKIEINFSTELKKKKNLMMIKCEGVRREPQHQSDAH